MNASELFRRLDRVQKGRTFKLIASAVCALVALGVVIASLVLRTGPEGAPTLAPDELDSSARLMREVLSLKTDPTSIAFAAAGMLAVALVIIWLGLGLTYLGLSILGAVLTIPLVLLGWRDSAFFVGGAISLWAMFAALIAGLRAVLAPSHPVFAIARNVLNEAVRMKASVVFIVILVLMLAALPGHLDAGSPLRYRVQTFLQYSISGSFWIIALMTLTFSVASVAFEQRDKIIWQTMTKPVAPWQYILGKWLGVIALNLVLLGVSSMAVFQFTEYLRLQPAQGEVRAFVPREGDMSQDRLILETQVLTARARVGIDPVITRDSKEFQQAVADFIEKSRAGNPLFQETPAILQKMEDDLFKSAGAAYRSIEPGQYEQYTFSGLQRAKEVGKPITLRYRVDAGSNRPDQIFRVTFAVGGVVWPVQEVGLGPTHTMTLPPEAIGDDGKLILEVLNGDPDRPEPNPSTMSFPEGGLEISYPVGSYRWNFLRVAIVHFMKLAFLAILAIWASTFLSFPVACLVAMGTFLAAESSGFLTQSLEYYSTQDDEGKVIVYKVVIHAIASAVAFIFKLYSGLRVTSKLVDGQLVSWMTVVQAVGVLGAWSAVLYGMSVQTFRKRELATYSGQ